MKKVENKSIIDFGFRIDTPAFLTELVECGLDKSMGILKIPINIFKNHLAEIAEIAIKIDNPELNIMMLRMNLYEVKPNEIIKCIKKQQKRIKKEKI